MLLFRRRCIKETIENPRTDLSCELKPETGLVFGKSPKPYSRRSKGHLDRGSHRGHSWTNIHPTPVPQQIGTRSGVRLLRFLRLTENTSNTSAWKETQETTLSSTLCWT